jgi:hypothetical protein
LTTGTVPVLIELTVRASRGSLIPMSTTVRSRYASLVAISGPAAIGTWPLGSGESLPQWAFGALTGMLISTQMHMFDPAAQTFAG